MLYKHLGINQNTCVYIILLAINSVAIKLIAISCDCNQTNYNNINCNQNILRDKLVPIAINIQL